MSSKRRIRRKVCGKKVRHASHEDALNHIGDLRRKGKAYNYMVPYKCPFCGGFHVGHPPKHVHKQIMARK